MAFAALGAAEVLTVRRDHGGALDLLRATAALLGGLSIFASLLHHKSP
jgi:hypothetical protein